MHERVFPGALRRARTMLIALAVASGAALGQAPSAPAQDKSAETFDEIERGLFVGANAGLSFIFNAPAPPGSNRPLSPGQLGAIELGFDLGDLLSVSVFLQGTANRAGKDYTGFSEGQTYSGDFAALTPGAALKLNLFGLADAQGTRRTFVYARGGGGYVMFAPRQLLPNPDILVFGGAGVEYYTRLRHFAVGLELAGTFLVSSGAVGFFATPTLRYAF